MAPSSTLPVARIVSDSFGQQIQLSALRGTEHIGRPFEFLVDVVCTDPTGLDPDAVVSSEATLSFEQGGTVVRTVHGLIAECRDLLVTETAHSHYQLRLVPRFWRSSLVETLEIYLDKSVPEIIQSKLELLNMLAGLDFELRLEEDYPKREFVVQYKETDLAFISRLCEHDGIALFFEELGDREQVIFSDANTAFRPVAPDGTAFFAPRGDRTGMTKLVTVTRMVPSLFVERDYNYRNPQTDLTAQTTLEDGAGGGVVEYGAHFRTEAEGKRLARIRSEERRAQRYVFDGESSLPTLCAGGHVHVLDHPYGDVRIIITRIEHDLVQTVLTGQQGEAHYRNTFTALSESTVFRPERRTPKPRIAGMLTGVIDAQQSGQYAELDAEGRYKVRFLFDTSDAPDGQASRACRMMQPHSGPGYGMHFPLRPGVEVLLTFIDGDPDRPIIAGTVPNPQTASPVGSENATKNVIRTGSGNEIDIDDADGGQRIKLTTPHASTVFQLGAPNAPEKGAMLQTFGASSTLASTGISNLTALNTTFSALQQIIASGSIESVAEPPDWKTYALTAVSIVDALAGVADTVLSTVESAYAVDQAAAQSEVTRRQGDLDSATNSEAAAKAAETQSKNDLLAAIPDDPIVPPATTASGPKTDLQAAITAYETALAKLATDEATLATARKDLALAQRKSQADVVAQQEKTIGVAATDPANSTAAKDPKSGAAVTARGAAQDVALDRWAVDGTELPAGDKKKALDAKLDAIINSPTASQAQKDKATAYKSKVADAKTKRDDLASKTSVLADAQKTLDDKTYQNTEGDTAQDIKTARTSLAVIKSGIVLFNAVCQLIGLCMKLFNKLKEELQWIKAIDDYKQVAPSSTPVADAGLSVQIPPQKVTHRIGSSGNTTMYGETRLFLHSPTVLVSASVKAPEPPSPPRKMPWSKGPPPPPKAPTPPVPCGKLTLLAEVKALLLSQDTAEVSGKNKALLSSQTEVGLLAKAAPPPTPTVGAPPRLPSPPPPPGPPEESKLTAKSDGTVDLTATKSILAAVDRQDKTGTVELRTCATQFLKLEQKSSADDMKIGAFTSGTLQLQATKIAKLLTGEQASLTIVDQDKMIEAVAGAWKLTMKDADGVKLGKQPKQLEITNDKAVLQFSTMCGTRFESSGATILGSQVEIKAQSIAKVSGGNKVMLG